MTTMLMTRTSSPATVADLHAVQGAARALVNALVEAGPEDPRWRTAGPVVSLAAQRLREAIGSPVGATAAACPAIVRESDFAAAARGLLARDVRVEDAAAAGEFVRLAVEATVALS